MGREKHFFTVVPRADVEPEMNWPLPVFEAGKCLVAFDGAALLLVRGVDGPVNMAILLARV